MCSFGSAGVLRGSGSGVLQPKTDATPFAAAGLRGGAEIALAPSVSARIYADLAVSLARTTLRLGGADVWTTAPFSGALGVAAVADLF